jgi:ATP-binding cassette subfamily F protein uup
VVDHLFVFEGEGKIRDFAGNYTQYRDVFNSEQRLIQKSKPKKPKQEKQIKPKQEKRSYKEQKEYETLEQEIKEQEQEKASLEVEINSGNLDQKRLFQKSNRIGKLIKTIEEKTMRWLELSEKQ